MSELEVQRESLLRSQRRLENANDGLSKSSSILRAMSRNVLYNKLILVMIIVMEVLILVGLLYLKLSHWVQKLDARVRIFTRVGIC